MATRTSWYTPLAELHKEHTPSDEDYNLHDEQKTKLLEQIWNAYREMHLIPTHGAWPSLLSASTRALECFANDTDIIKVMYRNYGLRHRFSDVRQSWQQSRRLSTALESSPGDLDLSDPAKPALQSSRALLSSKVHAAALARDNNSCVLTGLSKGAADVVCIAPLALFDGHFKKDLPLCGANVSLAFMKYLWRDKYDRWFTKFLTLQQELENVDSWCSNLICIRPEARICWEQGCFALKPLGERQEPSGENSLRLQFFWQRKDQAARINAHELSNPNFPPALSTQGLSRFGDNVSPGVSLHLPDGTPLESGDVITLRNHHGQYHELPDFDLLDLQWHVTRVIAMAGSGQLRYDDLDDSGANESDDECNQHRVESWCESLTIEFDQTGDDRAENASTLGKPTFDPSILALRTPSPAPEHHSDVGDAGSSAST